VTERAGPIALVTGGLHRVGAQISATLAAAGYRLALHGRSDPAPDDDLATALGEHATDFAVFAADFALPDEVDDLAQRVSAHFGRAPDLLVNNASLFEPGGWEAADDAAMRRHMQVNCLAPIALARAVVGRADQGQTQAIVNILDQRVASPVPDQFAYSISKQALWQATRTLAIALAPRVRVNAVAPGPTLPSEDYDTDQWDKVAAMLPLGRHSSGRGIADAVRYLATASEVTGQTLFVDGGASLRGWDRDFMYL